jgi:hypothetical protein
MLRQEVEQLASRYEARIQWLDEQNQQLAAMNKQQAATYERLVTACDALDATIDEIMKRRRGGGEA